MYLHQVLVVACRLFSCSMWDIFPRPGMEPRPLHWEHGVLATGPPRRFLNMQTTLNFLLTLVVWMKESSADWVARKPRL